RDHKGPVRRGLGGSQRRGPRQPDPWTRKLALGTWNVTSLAGKEPEIVRSAGNVWPSLMNQFSKMSGYKINSGKSEILNVGQKQINLEVSKQLKIQSCKIKYLGCYISANKKLLYTSNFLTLKNTLKHNLNNYRDLKLNLIGRINLVKMMWLSKFIFLFQCIPLTPPKTFFKEINSIITSFIWAGKTPRIKRNLLFCSKREGGLKLPNIELYQIAAQMFYIDQESKN
uniref:Reverse transcriptase domain-containing protein n=1 Tax=Esox lucius TaxID=8010 RepID=A0AAY5KQL8_ESOLU